MDPIEKMLMDSGGTTEPQTVQLGTGRSGSGRLRNFGAMNDAKFAGVLTLIRQEANDAEALEAVAAEEKKRGWA